MTTMKTAAALPGLWDLAPAVFTPLAKQMARLMRAESKSADEFHAAVYLAEVLLKSETTVALGILNSFDAAEYGALGYQIASSDGLGTWLECADRDSELSDRICTHGVPSIHACLYAEN